MACDNYYATKFCIVVRSWLGLCRTTCLLCIKNLFNDLYNCCISYTADVLRWGKNYWQAASEHADRPKVDVEVDAKIEGSLAAEASLIVLDTLELLVQTLALEGQAMLGRTLEVLLHLMGSNQSTEVMRNIFATQRAIVGKFPELVFEDETELCAELCTRLLRHCLSNVTEVRALACSSVNLLMRQNYNELGSVSC